MADKNCKCTAFTTCEYCKDTPARGRDERQMKGRKQEIEHIERMKNAELDLFKDKIADEVVGKMKKVKKVGAIKVVHGGGHKGENNQKRANRNQIEGNLGGGLNNALVPVQGQGAGGINLQDANSSSFQANNEQEHGLLVSIEDIEFFE